MVHNPAEKRNPGQTDQASRISFFTNKYSPEDDGISLDLPEINISGIYLRFKGIHKTSESLSNSVKRTQ